jgi:hypothetical protein
MDHTARKNIMAFVNEEYPLEEQERIDHLAASRPSASRSPGISLKWTVDRERDAFLVVIGKIGGSCEGTALCAEPEGRNHPVFWRSQARRFFKS